MIPKGPMECPLCLGTFMIRRKELLDGGLILTNEFEELDGTEITIGTISTCGSCGVQVPIGVVLLHNDVEDLNEGGTVDTDVANSITDAVKGDGN